LKAKTRSSAALAMILFAAIVALATSYPQATGIIGVATITTPPLTTSTTFATTVPTSTTTTISTTSTSFSTTATSTSTSTTSTYTSWSYTSTYSTTSTETSTYTSYTGTATSVDTSTSTVVTPTTQISTSTNTQASTTTVAVFPGCLIATATFGSELAPEVQLLRGFRDNAILKTVAGSGFMVAFNAWYYSFSPTVAGYLLTHPVERTIMKGVLYPLVGILKLSSLTFSATSAFPELAALLSGLVASSLIGAFYLGLPLGLVRAKIRRLQGSKAQVLLERSLVAALLFGLAALVAGEIFATPAVLIMSTVTVVLSMLFLSAAFTSARISRRLQTL